jgi:hypothetical protein
MIQCKVFCVFFDSHIALAALSISFNIFSII